MSRKPIRTALVSVYHKEGLVPIIETLKAQGVTFYSTGGTQRYLQEQGAKVVPVEDQTGYPSIFGGRVKTLHPKVHGGILQRRDNPSDQKEAKEYGIPPIDLVIVDLYPFEATLAAGGTEEELIEKIDIGGIALIRGAAKNFEDVTIVASQAQYGLLADILKEKGAATDIEDRRLLAAHAFDVSSHYDGAIFSYLNREVGLDRLKVSSASSTPLRYGENPHQKGWFFGDLDKLFEKLHGKELSYNNLVDVEAALRFIDEFKDETCVAILKHNNACGLALGSTVLEAYEKALAADPVSAFGGVIVTNKTVDKAAAEKLHELFFEVLIAPDFDADALTVLQQKKNRILLKRKPVKFPALSIKTALHGYLVQERDLKTEKAEDFTTVTKLAPTKEQTEALLFATKVCKHTKSNAIVLANNGQLLSCGVGQTSRVDSLEQAIAKAKHFNFELKGAVLASDAFFPFPDCVQIAAEAGIAAILQPGGSMRDSESVEAANAAGLAMVTTGLRHFYH